MSEQEQPAMHNERLCHCMYTPTHVPQGKVMYAELTRSQQVCTQWWHQGECVCAGRIMDFIESGKLPTDAVKFFVLDEADRLLDSGSQELVLKLFSKLPKAATGTQRLQVLPCPRFSMVCRSKPCQLGRNMVRWYGHVYQMPDRLACLRRWCMVSSKVEVWLAGANKDSTRF